jgi:very-short-patch-repair endonuclease
VGLCDERGEMKGCVKILSMRRKFIKYNPKLKATARILRKQSTLAEVLLWNELKGKRILGYDFHRQKPIGNYIVDFFCSRLKLAIEIDGASHLDRTQEDMKRQKELESLGIRFLRCQDIEVKQDLGGVITTIRDWVLQERKTMT